MFFTHPAAAQDSALSRDYYMLCIESYATLSAVGNVASRKPNSYTRVTKVGKHCTTIIYYGLPCVLRKDLSFLR